ncbi:WD40 repeat-like protein [Hyphopichia burtonii NRRL Y-1933]|uniref:WD40 repeat-like protein n=1 Tax=Hyphopichia burtonii NRRL Y-1933 TaxID=984485 RepID=A0A1E4RC28_9ASCO|nr:WD40 repeat-like protein [Hyphopichia burtonii NRRL Y-1933]ODV64801.1 WD40 repeat-like protein [Hyphopichia burtonii NRRL Y-1933]
MSTNKLFFQKFKSSTYTDEPIPGKGSSEIIHLTINASGTRLINTRTDRLIRIWKCLHDKLSDAITISQPHLKAVERIAWNPKTEHTFASVGRDDLVKIWNGNGILEKEIKVVKTQGKEEAVISQIVKYSSDGDFLSVVDRDSTVSIYDVKNNYTKVEEVVIGEHIYDMEWFNYDHEFLIFALHDGTIPIYRMDENIKLEPSHLLKGHRSLATCLSMDPRGRYFAVGSNEGVVSIWSTASMMNTKILSEVDEAIAQIDISRDGTYLAVGFDSGSNIKIYEYDTTEEMFEVPNSTSGTLALTQVKWFPTKTAFVYSSDNGRTLTLMRRPDLK